MNRYSYKLNFAGTVFLFTVPYELEIGDNCRPFICSSEKEDCSVSFQIGNLMVNESDVMIKNRSPRVWRGKDYYRIERIFSTESSACTSVILRDDTPSSVQGIIYPNGKDRVNTLERIMDASELEVLLADVGSISLHSSMIRFQEEAILFTAPSGVGKSTQADLWETLMDAEQINGDRSFIRNAHKIWKAYGSPFAGSSKIYKNENYPIRAIVVLRQASENSIRRVTLSEAFRYIYSETVVPRWNDGIHAKIMDIITELIRDVPVLMLQCTPDERAVNCLYQYLQEETHDC